MKLIKTTKHHYIYELSEREQNKIENGYKYLLFNKANYEDYKPSFTYDLGYEDWQSDTLEEALDFSINY